MTIDQQKFLIHMIRMGNEQFIFTGYDILKLNLETFVKVSKHMCVYTFKMNWLKWFFFLSLSISDHQICNELLFDVQNSYGVKICGVHEHG